MYTTVCKTLNLEFRPKRIIQKNIEMHAFFVMSNVETQCLPVNSNLSYESSLPVNVPLLPRMSAMRPKWLVWTKQKQEMSSLNQGATIWPNLFSPALPPRPKVAASDSNGFTQLKELLPWSLWTQKIGGCNCVQMGEPSVNPKRLENAIICDNFYALTAVPPLFLSTWLTT